MSGRRRRAIHPPSRRRTTHPPGPRRVPPRHSLRLAVRQLRVLGDQRGAVLPQHAHGHAHARGVERAGAAGGALGDGVLAPDDEARDAGHLDELGQGRLLLAAYIRGAFSWRMYYFVSRRQTTSKFRWAM